MIENNTFLWMFRLYVKAQQPFGLVKFKKPQHKRSSGLFDVRNLTYLCRVARKPVFEVTDQGADRALPTDIEDGMRFEISDS